MFSQHTSPGARCLPAVHRLAAAARRFRQEEPHWLAAKHTRRYGFAGKQIRSTFRNSFCPFSVINGTHPTLRADPYSPGAVLRALNALGWVIPPDEHDAHELLHVMLSSLEEEAIRPKKVWKSDRRLCSGLRQLIFDSRFSRLAACRTLWARLAWRTFSHRRVLRARCSATSLARSTMSRRDCSGTSAPKPTPPTRRTRRATTRTRISQTT